MFGTYHAMGEDFVTEQEHVMQALDASELIVVEMIMDSSKLFQFALTMMLPDTTLHEMVSDEEYKLIGSELLRLTGTDIATFDRMKPISLAATMSMAYVKEADSTQLTEETTAMDFYFTSYAKANNKEAKGLETMMEQADLLMNQIPLEEQVEWLLELVNNKDATLQEGLALKKAYTDQDLATIYSIYSEMPEASGELAFMVDERNHNWMKKIPEIIEQQPAFIAVGALHLPGKEGLIELLNKAGYTVNPIR